VGLAYSHHQPEDGFQLDPWAEYAVLEAVDDRLSLAFHRVPFDVKSLIDTYATCGRPGAQAAMGQYRGR
jgi:hypothetical protein